LLRQIDEGKAVALISDAGTPIVSDPGYRLAQEAISNGISVTPIPGASAPLAALVGSGIIAEDFRFCGFLPSKQMARRKRLEELAHEKATLIFFEGPSRISTTLNAIAEVYGSERPAVVARELTKMHETFHRGTASQLAQEFEAKEKIRGEIVIVIAPAEDESPNEQDVDHLLRDALVTMKTKQAAQSVAKATGLSKQELYSRALALKSDINKAP